MQTSQSQWLLGNPHLLIQLPLGQVSWTSHFMEMKKPNPEGTAGQFDQNQPLIL
jgi:hypothetical protein